MTNPLQPGDALVIVDVQNDFCPGGSLAVPAGDAVVPVLNRWIRQALDAGVPILASRDWHPAGHVSFQARGGPWPPHCVQNTQGSQFHPGLNLPRSACIFSKGANVDEDSYSAFGGTGLDAELRRLGVQRIWVGGLALDYCVRATVLDGRRLGFDVVLIPDGTRPVEVHAGDGARAVDDMRQAGVRVHTA